MLTLPINPPSDEPNAKAYPVLFDIMLVSAPRNRDRESASERARCTNEPPRQAGKDGVKEALHKHARNILGLHNTRLKHGDSGDHEQLLCRQHGEQHATEALNRLRQLRLDRIDRHFQNKCVGDRIASRVHP